MNKAHYILIIIIVFNGAFCQDSYHCFKSRFDSILVKNPVPLLDSDGDGIDDSMEHKLGTNPYNIDTDSDGIDDYLESFKYKTNPVQSDSDDDGLVDSIWSERIEFNYVIKIIAQVGKPFNVQAMNSFSMDTRVLSVHSDHVKIEYIVYPFIEPYLVPVITKQKCEEQDKFLKSDILTELSGDNLAEIRNVIKEAKSDLEKSILLINYIWKNFKLKDDLFSKCEPLMEIKVSEDKISHIHKDWSPDELYKKYDFQTVLNLNCIANEMIRHKSRGACGSTATLVASIFKKAGIPARIKQNFPFVTEKDSSQSLLIKNIKNSYSILDKYRNGMYGDNHFFNEIFINGHWIDLDTYRLGNKWQNKPYLKSIHFNNWSDVDFANEWKPWVNFDKKSAKSIEIRYQAYRTISIEEINPKH